MPESSSGDSFRDCFDEIAQKANPQRLASAFHDVSSSRKFPSIDKSLLDKIRCPDFLKKATPSNGDKFDRNYEILLEVYCIIEKHPEFIAAVLTVLDKVLPDCAKKLRGNIKSTQGALARE